MDVLRITHKLDDGVLRIIYYNNNRMYVEWDFNNRIHGTYYDDLSMIHPMFYYGGYTFVKELLSNAPDSVDHDHGEDFGIFSWSGDWGGGKENIKLMSEFVGIDEGIKYHWSKNHTYTI